MNSSCLIACAIWSHSMARFTNDHEQMTEQQQDFNVLLPSLAASWADISYVGPSCNHMIFALSKMRTRILVSWLLKS